MTALPLRVLVADDDVPARARVRTLLEAQDGIEVAGECADGREAVDALLRSAVDLVVLDVEMPRLDGFGVLTELGAARMPPVIFISAYSSYAVRAFEAYALDYLLKPFADARFAAAIDRARAQVELRRRTSAPRGTPAAPDGSAADAHDPRLTGLLAHLHRPQPEHYPDAIAIRTGDHYAVVRTADVDWIEADGNYTRVYVQGRPRILTKTLAALEAEVLDPSVFVRVHRSAIVNASRITAVEPRFHGELTLVLRDGTHVPCSRRHRKHLEERLYFTS